jgi:hypothetical protein
MQYAAVKEQFALFALQYEKLAQCTETVSESLQTPAVPGSG